MNLTLEVAPPPEKVPVQTEAELLGLLPGLRAENHQSGYRCGMCNNMKTAGWGAWVPDSIIYGGASGSREALSDTCRRNAFNGHGGFVCLSCARSIGKIRGFFTRLIPIDSLISHDVQIKLDAIETARRIEWEKGSEERRASEIRHRRMMAEWEKEERDLAFALQTRVLTDEEMQKVQERGSSLFAPKGSPYYAKDVDAKYQRALEIQGNLRITESKKA